MKSTLKKFVDLPLEEGKTYKTKFQTGELFHLKTIKYRYFKSGNYEHKMIVGLEGIYDVAPHLGLCPLSPDRLIPYRIEDGEVCVCSKCQEPI